MHCSESNCYAPSCREWTRTLAADRQTDRGAARCYAMQVDGMRATHTHTVLSCMSRTQDAPYPSVTGVVAVFESRVLSRQPGGLPARGVELTTLKLKQSDEK